MDIHVERFEDGWIVGSPDGYLYFPRSGAARPDVVVMRTACLQARRAGGNVWLKVSGDAGWEAIDPEEWLREHGDW